jgi:hypothetical protein
MTVAYCQDLVSSGIRTMLDAEKIFRSLGNQIRESKAFGWKNK